MADDTTNLVLEHLRRFQAQMTAFSEQLDVVQQDMRAIKVHMAAFMSSEASQDGEIAAMKVRLDRIERRLELERD